MCDVKFYFCIKYINKASAGGIRSMCTYSYTHIHVHVGLNPGATRHRNHQTKYSHLKNWKKKKKRWHTVVVVAAIWENKISFMDQCLCTSQVMWSQEALQHLCKNTTKKICHNRTQLIWDQPSHRSHCSDMSLIWCKNIPFKSERWRI